MKGKNPEEPEKKIKDSKYCQKKNEMKITAAEATDEQWKNIHIATEIISQTKIIH